MIRKQTSMALSSLKALKNRYKHLQEHIVKFSSQAEYNKCINHYDKLISNVEKGILSMAIGYRYTGTFYLKRNFMVSYNEETAFCKCDGSLFMREDLVSWQIEKGAIFEENNRSLANQLYYREAFKQPSTNFPITKDECVLVYEEVKTEVEV